MRLLDAFWGFIGASLLCAASAIAAPPIDRAGLNGRLASVEWLQRHHQRDDVVVLDASSPRAFAKQHIPGAQSAGLFTFGPREVSPAQMEARLRGLGLQPGHTVVIVDEGGTYGATRLFWDLLEAGMPADSLYVLDGGMARWTALGGPVTDRPAPPRPAGSVRVAAPAGDHRVRLPEFLAATADPRANVLLEALDPEYFYGGAAFFNRGGHVPHATLMPADDFFNADKTFKSPAELQKMLDHLGIRREQQLLTYCGGGGAAAVPFFAAKFLLGYPRVRMFAESQRGWLMDDRELPMWTWAAPQLVRDTNWLKGWANPMLKMVGMSQVTALDVRPAEAFAMGHVPLALNVPASVFGANLHRPEALAAALGAAGLDPAHEAVVFSEGGLQRDAALAFLLLEALGQQQVSIQLDHLDRWIDQGLDVARGPAQPAATAPVAATPAAYRPAPRPGVLLREPDGGPPGRFATVFIASGEQPPSRPPAGRVIHLPASRLLDAQRRPLPAHQVWARLAEAGVPRYARVVLFADAPGDAAINYVVLRMMGWTDLRVWLP